MEINEVLKKIKKLQKLYEGAKKINSEGEAAAAAAVIQKLLTKYNLSLEDLNDEEKQEDGIMEEGQFCYTYKSIGGSWESRLLIVLCKWNFCVAMQKGRSFKNMVIFGKKENIEMVKWLRVVLSNCFVELSKKRFEEYKKTANYAEHPIGIDTYQRSYLKGCVDGLNDKLREENKKDKEEDVNFGAKVTALVVRNKTAIDEYIRSKYKVNKAHRSAEKVNGIRMFGYGDGRNVSINKPISAGRTQVDKVKLL